MKILVVLGTPRKGSFNHAIAEAAVQTLKKAGHRVIFHDLYQERFNPVFTARELDLAKPLPAAIQRHCNELLSADGIVVIHPNWWGQPPALLKGWVDRVFRQKLAYKFDKGAVVGLLKARAAVVFNTANTPMDAELKIYGDPLDNLWKTCIFNFCGVQKVTRKVFTSVVMSSPDQRAAWLDEVRQTVTHAFA
jgi:putative NADPH-quinone reductase